MRLRLSDYIDTTPLDPIMWRFALVLAAFVSYTFLRLLWMSIDDLFFKGFIFGGLTMLTACGLSAWGVLTWSGRKTRRR